MGDLISRQEAIKTIEDLPNCYNGFSDSYDKAYIIGAIEEVPSADTIKEMERTIWELSNQVTALTEQIIKLKSEKS